MSEQTSDVGTKAKGDRINIFRIGNLWCFKYFFGDRDIFMEFADYYNRDKYRFEVDSVGDRDKMVKSLEERGFETNLVEDTADYTVKIDRFKKYAPILRNSIDSTEGEKEREFIMKDMASVEEAISMGARKS